MELPKHYSLSKDHDKHFEIHDSRDGKKFVVAKNKIHPATQIKIMKMQKLAEGGGVDPEDTGEDGVDEGVTFIPPGASAQSPEPAPEEQAPAPPPDLSVPAGLQADPSVPPPPAAQPGQAAPDQTVNYPTSAEVQAAQKQQLEGVQQEATATQKQNELMAAQYQKNMAQEQKAFDLHQQAMVKHQAQYDEMWKEVAAGKIDPQRYMHSKSTGSKIAAAIGIMLSGLGSGLSGQPNMAMQVLNKNIENDIESQKANLGIKQSLLSHNLQAQGNLMSAMNVTRLQMSAMAEGKLHLIAAQTGNPIIAARAQQHAAQIQQSLIPLRTQVAGNEVTMQIRKDVQQRLAGQGRPGVAPVDMQDLARAGYVSPATAEKEGKEISKVQNSEAVITDAYNKMREEQKWFKGTGEGLAEGYGYLPNLVNPEAGAREGMYKSQIISAIQAALPSKKLSDQAIAMQIAPFIKGSYSEKTKHEGLNGIIQMVRKNADPTPAALHHKIPGAIGGGNALRKNFNMGPVK